MRASPALSSTSITAPPAIVPTAWDTTACFQDWPAILLSKPQIPISLISIVLAGSQTPRTAQTPAQFAMPAFAWRLSDRDVADLVNFIRTSWGNSASVAFPGDVAGVRKAVALSARALKHVSARH